MALHGWMLFALMALITLNLAVSIAVAISPAFAARQKLLQLAVVWIVPALGGVLIGLFLLSQRGHGPIAGYRNEPPAEDLSQLWAGSHPPDQNT